VHVNLEDGLMTALITLPDETYHFEPSWRHFPHLTTKQHMLAYRSSDLKLSWDGQEKDNEHMGAPITCGYVKEGLELEASGDDDEEEEEDQKGETNSVWNEDDKQSHSPKIRTKRQSDQYEYTPTKTRCPLLLVADYRFFQEMGGSNTKTTINYLVMRKLPKFTTQRLKLLFLFQISLIDRVHKIYNDTIWQDRSVGLSVTVEYIFHYSLLFLLIRIKKVSKEWVLLSKKLWSTLNRLAFEVVRPIIIWFEKNGMSETCWR
jgi:disintegrin and metalloproteinase domain-containing protein 17